MNTQIARVGEPTEAPAGTLSATVNVYPYAYWPLEDRMRYARTLAAARALLPSGLLGGNLDETAARVFLVLETGAMLGLHPMAALQGIDVIEGTATISPQTMTALIRGAGHRLRFKESGSIGAGDYAVEWTLIRSDDPDEPITASWSLEDSVQAELVELVRDETTGLLRVRARSKNGNALNHEKYPKDMTQWRALGRLARRGAADVTMGIGYFPEELNVAISADGNAVRDLGSEEAAIIALFMGSDVDEGTGSALDDKADMAKIWQEHHARDAWTPKVQAAFDAHLSTLTKDTRPPKEGTPGNTGMKEIDGESPQEPAGGDESAPEAPEHAPEAPGPVTPPSDEAPASSEDPVDDDIEAKREAEVEEFERRSAAEYEASLDAQPPAPVVGSPDGGLFDASALQRGTSNPT